MNVLDGYAVVRALKSGYKIGIITGGDDPMVKQRIHYLGITDYYSKSQNKVIDYQDFKEKNNLNDSEILMMGDDIPDREVIKMAHIGACPPNAVPEIKKSCRLYHPGEWWFGCSTRCDRTSDEGSRKMGYPR